MARAGHTWLLQATRSLMRAPSIIVHDEYTLGGKGSGMACASASMLGSTQSVLAAQTASPLSYRRANFFSSSSSHGTGNASALHSVVSVTLAFVVSTHVFCSSLVLDIASYLVYLTVLHLVPSSYLLYTLSHVRPAQYTP